MAEHVHGQMDVSDQEKTFDGFISFMVRGAIVCIAILVFLALLVVV